MFDPAPRTAGEIVAPAFLIPFRAAIIGLGCATVSQAASAGQAEGSTPSVLTLACDMSGGGYTIRDAGGHVLENGDGVPLSPPASSVLRITAAPPRVQVTVGVLPHPRCAAGPVLHSLSPVRFTWCQARYEIVPGEAGEYTLHSTSSAATASGPDHGDTMEAFMVGECHPANQDRFR